jgi:hypothetical protein
LRIAGVFELQHVACRRLQHPKDEWIGRNILKIESHQNTTTQSTGMQTMSYLSRDKKWSLRLHCFEIQVQEKKLANLKGFNKFNSSCPQIILFFFARASNHILCIVRARLHDPEHASVWS